MKVTEPGLIPLLDEAVYLADPVPKELGGSLSNSGAKRLVPPSTPAHFRWAMDNPPERKPQFDVGHAVHAKVLGIGAPVYVAPFDNWMTKQAKLERDIAYEDGLTPLLPADFEAVEAMAEAVLAHPVGRMLFEKGYGTPEVSAFWRDPETNVMLRCRYDWLPDANAAGRLIVPDLKTAANANPATFGKSAADYGYFMQDAFYLNGLAAHGLGDETNAFLFCLVEKTPPYLVSVVQLDQDARDLGRRLIRNAIDLYASCMERDEWPGYTSEIATASLPIWFTRLHEGSAA